MGEKSRVAGRTGPGIDPWWLETPCGDLCRCFQRHGGSHECHFDGFVSGLMVFTVLEPPRAFKES